MGRIAAIACVIGLGCGRVGFDAVGDGAVADDAAASGARPVSIAYPTRHIVALLATTAVDLTPVTRGDHLVFAVLNPPLPAGIVFDTGTGRFSGIPIEGADEVRYTVMANNADGSASTTVSITTLPGYTVDTTIDGNDDDGGVDTTCSSVQALGCSLRAAIETTNRRATKQLILIPPGTYIVGVSAIENIQNDVVVAGAGSMQTLVTANTPHGYGLFAISTAHQLSLFDLAVTQFGAADGPVVHQTAGALFASECRFSDNASTGSGGVLFINGGASATFERSVFTGNTSFGGNGWGGVIDGEGPSTTIRVIDSYATQNQTNWGSFAHITTGTTLLLQSSTLIGNTSKVSGTLASPGGTYTLVNDTIISNLNTYATPDDSVTASAGIYLFADPAHYTLTNTLIAFNTDVTGAERNCNRRDLATSLTSNGGNLFSDDGRNCASYFTSVDRFMTDPGIDPAGAGDHGGMTPTVLLAPGSVAIDTGTLGCPATDQRGLSEPIGPSCDVGAIEMP